MSSDLTSSGGGGLSQATADARYLQLSGGTLTGQLRIPAGTLKIVDATGNGFGFSILNVPSFFSSASSFALVLSGAGAFTASRTWTFQDASDTVVGRSTTDTLSNKTLTDPAFAGGAVFKGLTSSAAAASATELPADKNFSIHKNTTSGAVHLAFNNGGTIVSVQLT